MPIASQPENFTNVATTNVRRYMAARKQVMTEDLCLHLLVSAGGTLPWEWDINTDIFRWAAPTEWLFGNDNRQNTPLCELVRDEDRDRSQRRPPLLIRRLASPFPHQRCSARHRVAVGLAGIALHLLRAAGGGGLPHPARTPRPRWNGGAQ